jgi:hypothetical protein
MPLMKSHQSKKKEKAKNIFNTKSTIFTHRCYNNNSSKWWCLLVDLVRKGLRILITRLKRMDLPNKMTNNRLRKRLNWQRNNWYSSFKMLTTCLLNNKLSFKLFSRKNWNKETYRSL